MIASGGHVQRAVRFTFCRVATSGDSKVVPWKEGVSLVDAADNPIVESGFTETGCHVKPTRRG